MCGRYTLAVPLGELVEVFDVGHVAMDEWPPRFNLAPSQAAPVIVRGNEGERRLGLMRWGLVPRWADDPAVGYRMINARAETAATKPAFRDAFRRRRCLIPADGFYEWRPPGEGKGPKTPFHIHLPGYRPFAMAGLWERWQPEGAEPLHSFTILTVDAPAWIRPVHHRMPAVLPAEEWEAWLAPGEDGAAPALASAGAGPFVAEEVTTLVNRPGNDEPACREPVPGGESVREG